MRLININTLELETFHESEKPPYACLSHRWGKDNEELSFQEFAQKHESITQRPGFRKIVEAAKVVGTHDLGHLWVDTCCIDKTSSAELSEAINSMWKWYRDCKVCLVYLADVKDTCEIANGKTRFDSTDQPFRNSEWFRRAWTLQELLAPKSLEFYNRSWQPLGSKSLWAAEIASVTGIDECAVKEYRRGGEIHGGWRTLGRNHFTVAERMCWAAGRESTRVEDRAYSLLGLFNLNMSLVYGEGDKAFVRLQEGILRNGRDLSLLDFDRYIEISWPDYRHGQSHLFPRTPDVFRPSMYRFSRVWHQMYSREPVISCSVTNFGLGLDLLTMPWSLGTYIGLVPLRKLKEKWKRDVAGKWTFREYAVLPLVTTPFLFEPSQRVGRHMVLCTNRALLVQQLTYLAKYDMSIGMLTEDEIDEDRIYGYEDNEDELDKYKHDEWWYRGTVKQDILLLPMCHPHWEDPGIVNGVGIQLDGGHVSSEHEWFDEPDQPFDGQRALKLRPGPDMYQKPAGTWFPESADGNTTIEFGFDMYQEFVCAFIHQDVLVRTDHAESTVATSAVRPLWSGQFTDWQNRGEYSYRHEVDRINMNGRPVRVTIRMYKSNHHHGFLTDEHFGRRVICSPQRSAYKKARRYMWCISSVTVDESHSTNNAWQGALGFRSLEELRIRENANIPSEDELMDI